MTTAAVGRASVTTHENAAMANLAGSAARLAGAAYEVDRLVAQFQLPA